MELDEPAHTAVLSEHLDDSQGHVGGCDTGLQGACEFEPNDLGQQHVDRLSEHHRLGFDPADSPTEDAEAVDHRSMGVGADQCVRDPHSLFLASHARDPLEVHLVDDASPGGDGTEVVEALLAPLEELVALEVALVLDLEVALARVREAT